MRVLITGGAGFIGSHLATHYHKKAEVVVLDNLVTGFAHNLSDLDISLLEGSILDVKKLQKAMENIDVVFHLAAMTSVHESMEAPIECLRINAEGTLNVLQAASSEGVKKLVFASSASIYGNDPEVPKREDMVPSPLSPYAITKLDGEYYCDMFSRNTAMKTVCLRFFNVFGPRQNPDSPYASAVPIFMKKALRNENIVIHGDGLQTRDFVYVDDVVTAMAFVAENTLLSGVFNVGYGCSQTINDLVGEIIRLTGSKSQIIHSEDRPGDVKHSLASIKKINAAGLELHNGMASGLLKMIDHTRG